MNVTITHPVSGFTGEVILCNTELPFTNGTATVDVDPSIFDALLAAGLTYVIGPPGPAPSYDANLDTSMTAVQGNSSSQFAQAQRAAFGSSVAESRIAASLAHSNRIALPRPALPTVTWGSTAPTGMDKYNQLVQPSGQAVQLNTTNPPFRLVNCSTANAQIDQTYWTIANGSNGTGTPGPLCLETLVTTDHLVAQLNPIASGGTLALDGDIEVWIDDTPLFIPAGPSNAAHSPAFLSLQWATKGTHTIRLSLALVSPGDTYVSTGDSIAPTADPGGIKLAILGDSWTEGTSFAPVSFARLLPRYLGLDDAAVCGQGGTGYTTDGGGGGKTAYGSTDRMTALKNNNPTDVIVFGTINDNSASSSTIQSAAASVYSTIATNLPSARVFVVLPQPAGATDAASTNHLANIAAVKAAAQAAGNVTAIVDPSDWLTGTGWSTSRTGDGNRDLFLGQDNTHPTPEGAHYVAQRLGEVLQRWLHN